MCNKAIVAAHREEHQSCLFPVVLCCGMMAKREQLTKAGCTVEGHISDHSGPKTRPHQQELLGHLFQAPGPLACHLERTFP